MTRSSGRTQAAALNLAAVAFVILCATLTGATAAAQGQIPLAVRITSPVGRTGITGTIRIVAQVQAATKPPFPVVKFFVNKTLLKTIESGPPYSADWVDENPFDETEIAVEVTTAGGVSVDDKIVLKPFEIIEASQVTSVLLEAGIYDKRDRFVTGLTAHDFMLKEDGVVQQIEMARLEAVADHFALLIDASQSMTRRYPFVRAAAERLATYLRPIDRVIVAPFTRKLGALTGPTVDRRTIGEAIAAIRPSGGTSIFDALVEMAAHLQGAEGRRAIILITDGYDENSTHTYDETLKALREAQATVYAVAIGGIAGISLKGERVIKQLAAETGGKAFFPPREQDLAEVYAALIADAQGRYLLAYTPENQALDGTWRDITLETRTGHVVRTRRGYFAPSPPPIKPLIEFTVTDPESQQYVNVAAEDLVVFEDGIEQTVETFQEAVAPVSVVLALDSSGSMRRVTDSVVAAARTFVEALRTEDALAVLTFADHPLFLHDLSSKREPSFEAIAQYQAKGGTALYDALGESFNRLERVDGRRAVVVMTDGRDEDNPGTAPGSVRTFPEVLIRLKETGVTVFGVGLGSKVDRKPLEQLAHESGGAAYFPADVTQLADDFHRVVENLRRRFVVGYTSTNGEHDGTWRNVTIKTRDGRLLVSSKGGYFAPRR